MLCVFGSLKQMMLHVDCMTSPIDGRLGWPVSTKLSVGCRRATSRRRAAAPQAGRCVKGPFIKHGITARTNETEGGLHDEGRAGEDYGRRVSNNTTTYRSLPVLPTAR